MAENFFASPADYDSQFQSSILEAATAVAEPFRVQQGAVQIAGDTVSGNTVTYNGTQFTVTNQYINPGSGYYTITPSAFQTVWPVVAGRTLNFPNVVFTNNQGSVFNGSVDCVGFACRVLLATGNTQSDGTADPQTNASFQLYSFFHNLPAAKGHFAANGFVPKAYEFATCLPLAGGFWAYIAGNVDSATIRQTWSNYPGVAKAGFSQAQAGDILCFGYTGEPNGHFMVLAGAPQLLNSNPNPVYAVPVLDCTTSPHFSDSRPIGVKGIGSGTIQISTDPSDVPTGFIWGQDATPHTVGDGHLVAISVGRFS
jgi:hypothetical protein